MQIVPGYWGVTWGELGTDGTAVAELQALAPGGERQISSEGPEWRPVTTAQQPMAFLLDTLACTSVCLADTFLSFWSAMARTKSFQKFKPPESQKVAVFGEEAIKLEPGHQDGPYSIWLHPHLHREGKTTWRC